MRISDLCDSAYSSRYPVFKRCESSGELRRTRRIIVPRHFALFFGSNKCGLRVAVTHSRDSGWLFVFLCCQFESGLSSSGVSLFSPLVGPNPNSWHAASTLSGLMPLSSMPSPSHRGVSMIHADGSITRDGRAVCDAVSLAVSVDHRPGATNGLLGGLSQPLTPLQSPLTPALGSFPHSDPHLYLHSSSASALSSSSLFDLNPSSSAMSTPKANHGFHNHASQDEAEDEDQEEDASLDQELEEEQEDEGREIDLDSEDEGNPAPPPHTNGNGLARSAATDETEEQQHSDEDRDLSDSDDDDDENALLRWVSESQRSGVDARTVLRRLLSDYSEVPISNKFLWKTAYSMSMHISQQLMRASARRQKLPHINTLDDVVGLIKKSSKIVVLTGAGISVAAGSVGRATRHKRAAVINSPQLTYC